jgi:hypothetical protein
MMSLITLVNIRNEPMIVNIQAAQTLFLLYKILAGRWPLAADPLTADPLTVDIIGQGPIGHGPWMRQHLQFNAGICRLDSFLTNITNESCILIIDMAHNGLDVSAHAVLIDARRATV